MESVQKNGARDVPRVARAMSAKRRNPKVAIIAARIEIEPMVERATIEDPDSVLMLRVRDGDAIAFRDLFLKYREGLIHFAHRFVGTSQRAEELVQDAFLQIYRARERYEARARFATYLYRVMTNLCLNERRRFAYQGRTEPLEGKALANGEPGVRELPDLEVPEAEEVVSGREAADRIRTALEQLPPNQTAALMLSRMDGFSYREVADCLGTSVSAIKSLVFRATQTLRADLQDLL